MVYVSIVAGIVSVKLISKAKDLLMLLTIRAIQSYSSIHLGPKLIGLNTFLFMKAYQ